MRAARLGLSALLVAALALTGCRGTTGRLALPRYLRAGAGAHLTLAVHGGAVESASWTADGGQVTGTRTSAEIEAPGRTGPLQVTARVVVGGHPYVASGRIEVCSQFIVLKADDLLPGTGTVVSPGWKRFFDTVRTEHLAADAGVIGHYLVKAKPAYDDLLRRLDASGRIQLFNHGWSHRLRKGPSGRMLGEFERLPVAGQVAHLRRTQWVVKKKTGVVLRAFGAPFNGVNADTARALAEVPELKTWFFGRFPGSDKVVLVRGDNAEHPTSHANADWFISHYDPKPAYQVLQIHPRKWTDADFAAFGKVVHFLRGRHACFVTSRVLRRCVLSPGCRRGFALRPGR